jgi:peptidoglycan/LPS O-acetylase OafA/YrhL
LNQEGDRHWSEGARARDWGNAFVVALVLSAAVVMAAIAIALFDNPARLASRHSTMSELPRTAQSGVPETDGRAR